jgi:hypothetical protein
MTRKQITWNTRINGNICCEIHVRGKTNVVSEHFTDLSSAEAWAHEQVNKIMDGIIHVDIHSEDVA